MDGMLVHAEQLRSQRRRKIEVIMRMRLLFLPGSLIGLASCAFLGTQTISPSKPLRADDPKGLRLPRGVPRGVDADGNVITIDHQFTTPQYQHAAAQMVLQEANRVAEEMRLADEVLPITETNVVELHTYPFGFSYCEKSMGGVVGTSHYVYLVGDDNKFNGLVVAGYEEVCLRLKKTAVPQEQMDTNAAYQFASHWLTSVSMDVDGLNQECKAHIAASPFWNGLAKLGQVPARAFVPIYYVWWTTPENDAEGFGSVASVELFLPTEKLLQLYVRDPKYILRKPLVFTNLVSLFPGTGRVIVFKSK
jgi:hypothetical protein